MIKSKGVLVQGIVIKVESTPVSDAPNSNLHVIECSYKDSTYTFNKLLNEVSFKPMDKVAFWFDPKNIERTIILNDDPDWLNKWLALVLGICATIFGFWIWNVPREKLIILSSRLNNFFESLGLKG